PQKERGPRGTPQPLPLPPPFLPYCERPDVSRPSWAPTFLEHYAMNGSEALAAAHAGIHIETLRQRRKTDAAFEAECDAAYTDHKQLTEWESHSVGRVTRNPLPFFAKLKKLDPTGYVERLVTVNASLTPEPDGVADLLTKMFGATLPGTLPLMVKKFGTLQLREALGEESYNTLVEAGKLPPVPEIIDADPISSEASPPASPARRNGERKRAAP